ncbi:phage baseplate assembly protein V [Collimonas pratensis]|uniref:Phage baseplate assembly V family protein n=1 Tax=Collimonas pratensis TaxID=279113 RepID=A0A127QA92_9BURK|nr:phage baseplate assembly protein V [Collimonas pratensis]AMP06532.1 phage baseplate assembly V family protein [Collimonas pratensis]
MQCMTADYSELLRLILNLIRFGTIADINHDTQRVRVKVGENVTTWRPWITFRAGDAQTWFPPSMGEQVIVLSPEGDFANAAILPAIYSDKYKSPSTNPAHDTTRYVDGTVVQYDSDAHTLTATLADGTSVTVAPGKVTSNAEDTECTGNLLVQKNLVVNQNLTVNGMSALNAGMNVQAGSKGGAAAVIQGILRATEDVIAGAISLVKHPHGGVKKGEDESGGPK